MCSSNLTLFDQIFKRGRPSTRSDLKFEKSAIFRKPLCVRLSRLKPNIFFVNFLNGVAFQKSEEYFFKISSYLCGSRKFCINIFHCTFFRTFMWLTYLEGRRRLITLRRRIGWDSSTYSPLQRMTHIQTLHIFVFKM